jgi:hypothetical protein
MVRSIGEWYSDHEDGSWGGSADDERVEKPEPWDVLRLSWWSPPGGTGYRVDDGVGPGPSAARRPGGTRSAAGSARARPAAGPARRSAPPERAQSGSDVAVPHELRERIVMAARLHPGENAKTLRGVLRATYTDATVAQVDAVLRELRAPRADSAPRRPARSPAASRAATPERSLVQRRSVPPPADLCGACGTRVRGVGLCRCS